MQPGMIWYFLLLGGISFILALVLYRVYIKYAHIHKVLAHPVERSSHSEVIPTGGGLIFAGLHLIFMLLATVGIRDDDVNSSLLKICFGACFIVFLGLLDDRFVIGAKYKLFIQVMLALLMALFGFKITHLTNPFGAAIYLDYFSIPITILWYLLIMNAINLIDGLDGLAAGITIISCLVLMVFSFYHKNFLVFINCYFLVITLFAFLWYNFSPAKIFMGDTGSLFIGFLLASLAIAGNEVQFKGLTTFTLLVPVTVIFIPLGDTFFTIFRRLINKQPVFKADKNHFHHKLVHLGLSQRSVTLICWFITLVFGLIALGYMFVTKQIMIVVLASVSVLLLGLFFFIYQKELFK